VLARPADASDLTRRGMQFLTLKQHDQLLTPSRMQDEAADYAALLTKRGPTQRGLMKRSARLAVLRRWAVI
jgi:hypothetical protein